VNRTAFGVSSFGFDPWRKEDKGNVGAVRLSTTVRIPRHRRVAARRERLKRQPLAPEPAADRRHFGAGLTRDGRGGWAGQGARIAPEAFRRRAILESIAILVGTSGRPCGDAYGPDAVARNRPRMPRMATVQAVCGRPMRPVVCPLKACPRMAVSVSHGVRVLRARPSLRVS
jgi:hypothetical protein